MTLTGDGYFGVEKNRRGEGKTPFGGRIALNVSPTFRLPAQSVPRREFCFDAIGAGNPEPCSTGLSVRFRYTTRQRWTDGAATLARARMASPSYNEIGEHDKTKGHESRRGLWHLTSAGLPTASDSQGGPHGQIGRAASPPVHTNYRLDAAIRHRVMLRAERYC